MKVFLSWSGDESRQVALALRDWLPQVINAVAPFMSTEDIEKGSRGLDVLARELEGSLFGIVCVTRDNFDRPWVNFEAGALSKQIGRSLVVPLLFRVDYTAITGPLTQFQHVLPNREDIYKLLESLNNACDEPRSESQLTTAYHVWWPHLEAKLNAIEQTDIEPAERDPKEQIAEILDIVRGLQRTPRVQGYRTQVSGPLTGGQIFNQPTTVRYAGDSKDELVVGFDALEKLAREYRIETAVAGVIFQYLPPYPSDIGRGIRDALKEAEVSIQDFSFG